MKVYLVAEDSCIWQSFFLMKDAEAFIENEFTSDFDTKPKIIEVRPITGLPELCRDGEDLLVPEVTW